MKPSPSEQRNCAFITGAAAGIGRATARLFAERGWFVGIADADASALMLLAAELGAADCLAFRLDVTNTGEWQAELAAFFERTGRLDLLVNNAGILVGGAFESSPLDRHQAQVDVNIKGVINGCYLARPYLARTPGARLINLSSSSAVYGQASLATYSATKFAVRGLTEALNIEWEKDGIRVMDIMPLFVRTAMVKDLDVASVRRLGVHLTPDDVAAVIWKAAAYRGSLGKVHWPVGFMSWLLHAASGAGPDRLARYVARHIAS
jgi:NAD(P)-dependent dehydrogenase (short-subunit alcohol dehydrogenase family)